MPVKSHLFAVSQLKQVLGRKHAQIRLTIGHCARFCQLLQNMVQMMCKSGTNMTQCLQQQCRLSARPGPQQSLAHQSQIQMRAKPAILLLF